MDATLTPGFVEHRNDARPRLADLPDCPVETTAQLIGSKWRLLIMRDLLAGPLRFGELQRSVGGISQKVLTSNLRDMEERGLVVRRVYPEVPPRVEYGLTGLGQSLGPVIDAMRGWGEAYRGRASGLSAKNMPLSTYHLARNGQTPSVRKDQGAKSYGS